jgi:hypothetical protein
MESLRTLPRNVAIAALALAVAVALVELLALMLGALVPTAAVSASSARVQSVLLVSPLLLIFYAGPLVGLVGRRSRVAWPLAGFLGLLPGLALGSLAGLAVYGCLVGVITGLGSVGLSHFCVSIQHRRSHG